MSSEEAKTYGLIDNIFIKKERDSKK
jgi:ATP-dependent protease ClpP protease subunit